MGGPITLFHTDSIEALDVILLVFPHQLFSPHPGLEQSPERVLIIEDALFFGDDRYPAAFHQQKLWMHRATMKRYEATLRSQGHEVRYLDYNVDAQQPPATHLAKRIESATTIRQRNKGVLGVIDPVDFILRKRICAAADLLDLRVEWLENLGFLNTPDQNAEYRGGKKRWFMADYYKWQRQRLGILVDGEQPEGGQWSFDEANRKKVPKKLLSEIPSLLRLKRDAIDKDAVAYVTKQFPRNPGSLDELYYPTSHRDAQAWLRHFVRHRLERFGDYEDAIVEGESWLWHSVLTPPLNIGLLTPDQVLKATLTYAKKNGTPLNSLEGFVRQVIGWREFMRATYEDLGVTMRTTNHWQHHRPIPDCFYDASTGILPIDDTIQRLLRTGYCHHIERLMVLGGFLFLCEIDPDDIYRWFMEMFVDSYDWVMVPNVYAMSQNADGGLITTKPYFSGSSYVRKMSHHKKGPWCDIWDGLYWRWIWNHVDQLGKNPRWAMMCKMAQKMEPEKRAKHIENAERFLKELDRT